MQKPAITTLMTFAALMTTSPAQADFALLPPASDLAPAAASSDSGLTAPAGKTAPEPSRPPAAKHTVSRIPSQTARTARGFGTQIPLSFAVRQIVPSSFAVVYGRGTDRNTRVDWSGGRPWPRVLQAVVRPLGLHLTIHEKKIVIAK